MGYNIKVDHSQFSATATAIEKYNTAMKAKMKNADSAITTMMGSWKGKDATAFQVKWNAVNNTDSTYMHLYKSLDSYAKFLKAAAEKYKTAQIEAINRASRLPKW